jgi:hypothetical protein
MPQFDFFVFLGLVLFTLVTFFFLYTYTTKDLSPLLSEVTKTRAKIFSLFRKSSTNPVRASNEAFKTLF